MRKQVAIAYQGGGLNAAFTAGVLKRILTEKEPDFDPVGLSGTSPGRCAPLSPGMVCKSAASPKSL